METGKHTRLQFRIDLVLTVLFLATIFFFPFATAVWGHGLWGHTFYFDYVSEYLEDPEDYTAWELVEASKNSLDNFIASNIFGTSGLNRVNSAFQYSLGKRMVSTGGTQMIRLNTGHLYDMQSYIPMDAAKSDILNIRSIVPEDVPFLFVYEHPTLYDMDAQMPEGYGFLDFSAQMADEVVNSARESGIEVIDSRDVYRNSGLTLGEFQMRTDQHWTTRAALTMARTIAEYAREATGKEIPAELLDESQFDTREYPGLFLGKYGQRVGTRLIDPDDIIVYTPKYDTHIQRSTLYGNRSTNVEGTFERVNIRKDVLEPDAGKTWNVRAYCDYGLIEDYDICTNENGADCTILLLKDSYSAPIGRFLSLVAENVYSVDLRYRTVSLKEWIEKCDPDIVVVSYSMQMLLNKQYDFE